MGDLLRSQMEDQIRFRMGNRMDIIAQLTEAVKFAYDELVTAIEVPENQETAVISLNTTEFQNIYLLPTDLYVPYSIKNTNEGKPLKPLTPREYDAIKDTITRGEPKNYVWWRNELIIQPPNDTTVRTLSLRYTKRLPALSAASSMSALPREWDEVIIQGGLFRLQSWLGLKEDAMQTFGGYNIMVSARIGRLIRHERVLGGPAAPSLIDKTADEAGWRG